jgi:predicted membrane protein
MKADRIVLGIALLVFGTVWLLVNLGILQAVNARELWRYWPILLVLWGVLLIAGKNNSSSGCLISIIVILLIFGGLFSFFSFSRNVPADIFPVELHAVNGVNALKLDFVQHAGEFSLNAHPGSSFLKGTIRSTYEVEPKQVLNSDKAAISIHEPAGQWPYKNRISNWAVTLSEQYPTEVVFRTGAAQAEFNLSRLQISDLQIKMGAGDLTIQLGSTDTNIRVESGAGSYTILVPEDTGVRLRLAGGLVSFEGEKDWVITVGERYYESSDMENKTAVADIEIVAGAGSVKLKRIR